MEKDPFAIDAAAWLKKRLTGAIVGSINAFRAPIVAILTRSKALIALVFCIATGIAVPLLYNGLFTKGVSWAESVVVHLYVVAWYVCLAMFGGVHGAPAWAGIAATIFAVICENLIFCWVIFRLHAMLTRRKVAIVAK